MRPVEYLKHVRVPKTPARAWREIGRVGGTKFEGQLRDALDEADAKMAGGLDSEAALAEVYPLLYRDLDVALAAHGFSVYVTRGWMDWVRSAGAPTKGRLLDLGCGAGVITCWHAIQSPDLEAVGVDRSVEAIAVAEALAERLGLRNVRFVAASLESGVDGMGAFDHLISVTAMHGGLPNFDSLAGSFDSPADMANRADEFMHPPAKVAADLAAEGAPYWSLERLPTSVHDWVWWHSLQNVGFGIDMSRTTRIELMAGQAMPLTVAVKGATRENPRELVEFGMRQRGLDSSLLDRRWGEM